jgi:hypothetical protein
MVCERGGVELHVGDVVLLRAKVIDLHPEADEDGGELDTRVEIDGARFPNVAVRGCDCRLARAVDLPDEPRVVPVAEAATHVETA